MKELTKESLEEAIAKVHAAKPGEIVEVNPRFIVGTAAQAAALAGVANTQSTMQMKTTGRYNVTDHMTGTTPLKVHGRPVEVKPFEVNPDMTMLEDASSPYNVDVETLANLWVARFGKGWVSNDAVEDMDADQVDWWRHAANRLRELGYLEMHTLASSYRVVLRIVE